MGTFLRSRRQQKRSRQASAEASAEIAALTRWSAVLAKEHRRKNISHPPNSAPVVRAFTHKAEEISASVEESEENDEEQTSATDAATSLNFTLANMYRCGLEDFHNS